MSQIEQLWSLACPVGSDYRLAVFDELICQRLLKGFQIVLLDKKYLHAAIGAVRVCAGHTRTHIAPAGARRTRAGRKGVHGVDWPHLPPVVAVRFHAQCHLVRAKPAERAAAFSVQLSVRSECVCTRAREHARQVPDADNYVHNSTHFECDNLETINWSLLDNYVVNMGRADTYR